ncbi:aldo-keto reductase AKR2E4-like [Oppia nitens]|uniref:aldo-keto reductase AKR2E4-like n=1 Tax=Oppia nitens TaxID=1686743 RepID=UPI0023DC6A95|nr:aldo-keto reductase AKR2E4-like [Oppia nitens]
MQYLSVLVLALVAYSTSALAPTIKLNTGYDMPVIGLGTWQATGQTARQAVKDAIAIGYRHIDTASHYGNEHEVGQGLHDQINAGLIKREDVFITTKVWPQGTDRRKALESVRHSVQQLNVSYVDLVLLHFPENDWINVYRGMEDAYHQKLTRSIGISNCGRGQIDQLLRETTVKPAVNQISIQPRNNQDDTVNHCNELGIVVTGFSPLGTGSIVKDHTLASIGTKHQKSAAQVALRWQIQRHLITIPKATNPKYIKEDFEIFDFQLTNDEMNTIHNLH